MTIPNKKKTHFKRLSFNWRLSYGGGGSFGYTYGGGSYIRCSGAGTGSNPRRDRFSRVKNPNTDDNILSKNSKQPANEWMR